MAANVLFDPTHNLIQMYNEKQVSEEGKKKKNAKKKVRKNNTSDINNVNQLNERDTMIEDPIPNPSSQDAKNIAKKAFSYATKLHRLPKRNKILI